MSVDKNLRNFIFFLTSNDFFVFLIQRKKKVELNWIEIKVEVSFCSYTLHVVVIEPDLLQFQLHSSIEFIIRKFENRFLFFFFVSKAFFDMFKTFFFILNFPLPHNVFAHFPAIILKWWKNETWRRDKKEIISIIKLY